MPLVSFNTPLKHGKTRGFLYFQGGIEIDQWHVMSQHVKQTNMEFLLADGLFNMADRLKI